MAALVAALPYPDDAALVRETCRRMAAVLFERRPWPPTMARGEASAWAPGAIRAPRGRDHALQNLPKRNTRVPLAPLSRLSASRSVSLPNAAR